MPSNPFLKSVTLTAASTNYNLLTLIQALEPGQTGRCCKLAIQNDTGNGAAHLFVGNEDVSGTNFGANLVATQVLDFETVGMNLINASDIWLRSDTASIKVNIALLQQ